MFDEIIFANKLFAVENRRRVFSFTNQGKQLEKEISYQCVIRPPGVRAILYTDGKVLLVREYRYELGKYDYRLPGGKVFDDFNSYHDAVENSSVDIAIKQQLFTEVDEEAHYCINNFEFFKKSTCGFTVEWDLYYYLVHNFEASTVIKTNEYEYITNHWFTIDDVEYMCYNGEISEERTAMTILQAIHFLKKQGKL